MRASAFMGGAFRCISSCATTMPGIARRDSHQLPGDEAVHAPEVLRRGHAHQQPEVHELKAEEQKQDRIEGPARERRRRLASLACALRIRQQRGDRDEQPRERPCAPVRRRQEEAEGRERQHEAQRVQRQRAARSRAGRAAGSATVGGAVVAGLTGPPAAPGGLRRRPCIRGRMSTCFRTYESVCQA